MTRLSKDFYIGQEAFILEAVRSLRPYKILELGCNYGRITKRLAESMNVRITAYDISEDAICNAKQYCVKEPNIYEKDSPGVMFFAADVLEIERFPKADLCLAVELFLHLSAEELKQLVPRILDACPVLVHDFDVQPTDFISPHIFNHNYPRIYTELGCQSEWMKQEYCFGEGEEASRGEYGLMKVTR